MKILTDAGFDGYASAEYEGEGISEMAGSIAAIKLLQNTRDNTFNVLVSIFVSANLLMKRFT